MTVAGLGAVVHDSGFMTAEEKILALPKPLKNRRKPREVVIEGVRVTLYPHPLRSRLPMARVRKAMRQIIAEEQLEEAKAPAKKPLSKAEAAKAAKAQAEYKSEVRKIREVIKRQEKMQKRLRAIAQESQTRHAKYARA